MGTKSAARYFPWAVHVPVSAVNPKYPDRNGVFIGGWWPPPMLAEEDWNPLRPLKFWTIDLSAYPSWHLVQLASAGLYSEAEVLEFLQGKGSTKARIHEVGLLYPDGKTMDSFYRGRKYVPRSEENIRSSEDRIMFRLIGLPDSTPPPPPRIRRLSARPKLVLP